MSLRRNVGLSQGLPFGKALAGNDDRSDGGVTMVSRIDPVRIVVTVFIDKGVEWAVKYAPLVVFAPVLSRMYHHGRRGVPTIAVPLTGDNALEEAGEHVKY
jgi:hypothetical protein